jgi:hypothetical protein
MEAIISSTVGGIEDVGVNAVKIVLAANDVFVIISLPVFCRGNAA